MSLFNRISSHLRPVTLGAGTRWFSMGTSSSLGLIRQGITGLGSPMGSNVLSQSPMMGSLLPFGILQRRWKSRGNTYQPSTLKRKRKFGFLAKARDSQKCKILKRRRLKGRWYLTH
ncbi:hypothetical protein NCAS_0B03820 [Naumovozyma castellii]|uniref:Large ribosomal subunit protein bL34m n=1 Tax=Naumovozyma castellii TaxID=27288 RepID=G0VBY9_NAUCA|nr:hypothetical protein NCAS_0B03820 [Naumovozyma castellii CBS 4309]CCC68466.1 hypothetical protein NCAS_0B03820 [Naumovozyma castellii CBS 4309]